MKKQRDSGITLTTLGFGTGNYNESMMEKIADVGNGNYGYVDSANEARKLLDEELSSTLFTIAQDVKVQVEFNPALVAEYRLVGYENRALREEDFANDKVDAGDIGAGHQVTALYEIVPAGGKGWLADRRYASARPAATDRTDEAAWLKLRYKLPGEATSRLVEQPIAASQIASAGPATGDFAFAAAVGAFGQRLRGDPALGNFSLADIRTLAGSGGDDTRKEFLKLVSLAQGRKVAALEGKRMKRNPALALGLLATLAAAAMWHGPGGAAARFTSTAERTMRITLDHYEMPGVAVKLQRDPLTRIVFRRSGRCLPAQRNPPHRPRSAGYRRHRLGRPPGPRALPLLAEVMLMALACFAIGAVLAYIAALRRRARDAIYE